jgi:hypothetical protein
MIEAEGTRGGVRTAWLPSLNSLEPFLSLITEILHM